MKLRPKVLTQIFWAVFLVPFFNFSIYAQSANAPCNTPSNWNNVTYNNISASSNVDFFCLLTASVWNVGNVVSANPSDNAQVNLTGLGCSATVTVRDTDADTYPAGYFAGFEVSSNNLITGDIWATVTVSTYNNGAFQESYNAVTSTIGLDASLLSGGGNGIVGFVTTKPFDEIRITYSSLVSILGSYQVYNAVIEKFCPAPALNCNTQTSMTNPTYPVYINSENTGISSLTCSSCKVNDANNVINSSTSDYASIVMLAGVAGTGSLSVKDQLTDYPAGTFAGFDIENPSLVNINLLSNINITTYLNGVLQESKTGNSQLLSIGSNLFTSDGRRVLGFISTKPFDEVQINVQNLASLNIGSTNIYRAVIQKFCPVNLECNQTYFLSNPQFPVAVDGALSGVRGVACSTCSVTNWNNVISASQTDYTTITVGAGLATQGSIAVVDGISTYPSGSVAGFVVEDANNLLNADLFRTLTICTYLDGVQQECQSGGQLLDFALLVNWIGTGPGKYNVGFRTTKPFDEIRLSVSSLTSLLNVINVYSGFVDTRGANGGTLNCCPIITNVASNNVNPNACGASNGSIKLCGMAPNSSGWTVSYNKDGAATTSQANLTADASGCITLSNLSAGYYTNIKFTHPTFCPSGSNVLSASLTNPPAPAAPISGGNVTVCSGNTTTLTASNCSGTYNWYAASTGGTTLGTGSTLTTPTLNTTTTYYVDCTVSQCTSSSRTAITATVNQTPSAPNATGATICTGNTAVLTASGCSGRYNWYSTPTGGSTLGTSSTFVTSTLNTTTTYYVDCTSNGCTSTTRASAVATVNPLPTLSVTQTNCSLNLLNYTITFVSDGTVTSTAGTVDNTAKTVSNIPTGTNVTLTSTLNGCTTSIAVTAPNCVCPTVNAAVSGGDKTICQGQPIPILTATVGSNESANWYDALGTLVKSNSLTYTPTAAGTYFVEAYNTISMCKAATKTTVTLIINNRPGTPASVNATPSSICTGSTATLSGSCPVGSSISWYTDTTGTALASNSISPTTTTTYYAKCINPISGCTSYTNSVTLSVTTTPTAPTSVSASLNSVCTGQNTTLSATCTLGTLTWYSDVNLTNIIGTNTISVAPSATTTYYASCVNGTCKSSSSAITITNTGLCNKPPVATNDIATTPQGKPVSGNVLTNDDDPNGNLLIVSTTPVTSPTKGSVVLNPDGTYTYTPNSTATGQDTFCYKVCDNGNPVLCDTACVTITIIAPPSSSNDKPVANDDNTQTSMETTIVINAKANDTDPDGNNTLGTPLKLTNPTNGSVTQNPDGTFNYTPKAGFTGTDSFTYQICDNGLPPKCDTATITINVLPTPPPGDQPPVAIDDANITEINVPVNGTVAGNDSDPDNSSSQLVYTKLTDPTNGTVVQNPDGTYTYTPSTGFVGNATYTYKVCDPLGKCDTATVTIAILPSSNQPPIATNDIATTPQNKPVSGNVLINDDDPNGNPLTVTTTPVIPPSKGSVTLNSDGTFTYTPNPGVTGQDSFCYKVCDNGNPALCSNACVTITIVPPPTEGNDKPVANDDNTQTTIGTTAIINVKANDTDPDGNNTLGTPTKLTNPTNGTVTQNPDGTFNYIPKAGFTGTDSFTYQICDAGIPVKCDTATVTINILPTPPAGNQPPVAVDDANLTQINTSVSGTVAANDSDPDNASSQLFYVKLTNPTNGTVILNPDGTYTYKPATNFVGSDTYTYKVCDPLGKCDTATVTIAITPSTNQPPVATNDITTTPQDKPVTGNVLTNDNDPNGHPLIVTTTPVTSPTKGTVVLSPNGTFIYTPNPGVTGQDTFCYKVCDNGNPIMCDTACVSVNIIPSPTANNDKPVANDDNTQTTVGTPVAINVKANDTDPDGNNTLGIPSRITSPTNGTVTQNPDGSFNYLPQPGFTGTDSFTYQICDAGTPVKCDTATVTINILPTPPAGNQPPVAVDDAALTTTNTPVSGTVAANDSDPDNSASQLTYTRLSSPTNGSVLQNPDGTFTYTPGPNFIGSDSYIYKVCDLAGKCDTATVTISVTPPAPGLCLSLKAYLQGALFGVNLPDSLMRDDLRVKGLLPTTSPYLSIGWGGNPLFNTTTASVISATSPTTRDAIVDWVFIELRNKALNSAISDSRSALIQRDGDIVDVDGVSPVRFNSLMPDNYFVAVRHRNHLGVMTKTAVPLSSSCTVIDFRKSSTPTFVLDASNPANQPQVVAQQGMALWAGNSNLSLISPTNVNGVAYQGTNNDPEKIYNLLTTATGNIFATPYYKLKAYTDGDINMNGEMIIQGTGNDIEYIYQNIIKNHPGNIFKVSFFIIREQLPN